MMQTGFENLAQDWWDESGPMAPLHRMTPTRIGHLQNLINTHFPDKPPAKISLLDIGCGGGIVCEPMARYGYKVSGIDLANPLIDVAKQHAESHKLSIDYHHGDIAEHSKTYDVVLVLEVLEHVDDWPGFLKHCAERLKPGGLLITSTLNRTPKSYAFGIVAAEYILKWLPKGTHEWSSFIKPSEMAQALRQCNLTVKDTDGLIYNPITKAFSIHPHDVDVNYFMSATKS